MIDPATMQAIAALGAMLMALLTLIGGWIFWTERRLIDRMDRQYLETLDRMDRQHLETLDRIDRMDRQHREALDRMDRRFQDMQEQMGQNHREMLALLEGHAHDGGPPPVFRRLTGPAD